MSMHSVEKEKRTLKYGVLFIFFNRGSKPEQASIFSIIFIEFMVKLCIMKQIRFREVRKKL